MLFEGTSRYSRYFDAAADGKRFLMIRRPPETQGPTDQVTVVLNWFEELRRRMPAEK